MARNVSTTAKREFFNQESGDPFLLLLTITDPEAIFPPIYLVNNLTDIVSNTKTFIAFPMAIGLPIEDGESNPTVQIRISNVTLEFITVLRSITKPLEGKIQAVLASNPNQIEMEATDLELRSVTINQKEIIATFGVKDILNLGLPGHSYTPTFFPALFQ